MSFIDSTTCNDFHSPMSVPPTDQSKPQASALPEQFYRSRTTSIVMSALAFAFCVIDAKTLKGAKVFDIPIGSVSSRFLIIAFTGAALISFVSLCLSYFHEGKDHLRQQRRTARLSYAYTEAIPEVSRQMSAVMALQTSIERIFFDDGVLEDNSIYSSASFVSHHDRGGHIDYAEKQIATLFEAPPVISVYNPDYTVNRVLINLVNSYYEELYSQDAFTHTYLCQNLLVEKLLPEVAKNLKSLRRELSAHRRAARNAFALRIIETSVIGVGVPALMLSIAMLHAIGALGTALMPTLPVAIDAIFLTGQH